MSGERLVFDIETNSIRFGDPDWLASATHVWCIVVLNRETGEVARYSDEADGQSIQQGLARLEAAEWRYAHNGAGFDEVVLRELYDYKPRRGRLIDTLAVSEAVYGSDLRSRDYAAEKKRRKRKQEWIEQRLYGSHSLEAWGQRLGDWKDDYKARAKAGEYGPDLAADPFCRWSQALEDYCEQDVRVTAALVDWFGDETLSQPFAWIESEVYRIVRRMEAHGWPFDEEGAQRLYSELAATRDELKTELRQRYFPPFYALNGETWPKRGMRRASEVKGLPKEEIEEGAAYTKIKKIQFNPASRMHIASRLQRQYGWKPTQFTADGRAQVDEGVMQGLSYPPCAKLREYLTVEKRCGQLAEGKHGWLKMVRGGRIHARYRPNGTRTGRMSCSNPNLQQVPASYSEYGPECRRLFRAPPGYALVGWDAEGLELRLLAHDIARHDGGAYGLSVVEGNKADETDVHNVTKRAAGFNSRDSAKTLIYAFIYGAGDLKIGRLAYDDMTTEQRKAWGRPTESKLRKLGASTKDRVLANIPGLEQVKRGIEAAATKRGWLRGIDGRRMRNATAHNGLNTRLQGNGGQVMKLSFVLLDWELEDLGWTPGVDWEFVGMIHDEGQAAVRLNRAAEFGGIAAQAITRAGEYFRLRVRLDANYQIGETWNDTH